MQFSSPLVVKTPNLKVQIRMNSEVKASYLLKFIGTLVSIIIDLLF